MTGTYALAISPDGVTTFYTGIAPEGARVVTAAAFAAAHEAAVAQAAAASTASLPKHTAKADIWRRATDAQAEALDGLLAAQTPRQRRLYEDAAYLDHADPLFASLHAAIVTLFDTATADALLAPSQG